MKPILPLVMLGLGVGVLAQTPPASPPAQNLSGPPPSAPEAPLRLALPDALKRAAQYSQQVYSARFAALLAHEDAVQAKAALLPSATGVSQFIYTQPNGTPSGVFVSNDGPHVYNDQLVVHGEIFNPAKRADYQRTLAAEGVARAKADLASRGLVATVTQNYYSMVVGQRKIANARLSLDEAQQFLDLSQKQEQGGEVAHVDVVKAQIQVQQRQRELEDAQGAYDKARIGFAVLLFPNYGQQYSVTDDLDSAAQLPSYADVQSLAGKNSPDIRVAQATVLQQNLALKSARAGFLPTLSFDYFFGINANQFAIHNPDDKLLLGSVAQAQLSVPIWNWGATRSKIKQAELQVQQARADLSFTQRTLLSEIDAFFNEARIAAAQLQSLKSSLDLSAENLRLTRLRYTAGESPAQEVVDAQAGLATARNAYDDGLVRYRLALANLQTLTGTF